VYALMLFPLYCMLIVAFTPRDALFDSGAQLWPDDFTTSNFTPCSTPSR
jgi:ABC-type glycerol-3-phosphate transport system permease component